MRDLIADIDAWRAAGVSVAVASVVQTWGSAPRQAGAAMAIGEGGRLAGSVSGGCVESAVIEAAGEVLAGAAPRLLAFDVANERAMSVGLPCGGRLRVLVERLAEDPATEAWLSALRSRRPVARVVGLSGEVLGQSVVGLAANSHGNVHDSEAFDVVGTLGDIREMSDVDRGTSIGDERPALEIGDVLGTSIGDETSLSDPASILRATLSDGGGRVRALDGHEFFACAYPAPDRLVIVGAVHIAQPLVRMAREIGYQTALVDPRAALATAERFPDVDEILVEWPAAAYDNLRLDYATDVVVLSHDDKIDDPAISTALQSAARYVGALGSRKRTAARAERLLAAGLSPSAIDRLDAPIGLEIGARSPEEIAVSILARLVEVRGRERSRRQLA